MGENLLDKALKNVVGGAAAAGGAGKILELLQDLDDQMRIFNKRYNGAVGGWDKKQLGDVQFQTYQRYRDQPDQLYSDIVRDTTGPAPNSVRIPTRGFARFAGVTFSLSPPSVAAASVSIDMMVFGGPFMRVFDGTVSPSSPFISFVPPEPYPTIAGPHHGAAAGIVMERCQLWVTIVHINPADHSTAIVDYFDRVDNP